MTDTKCLALSAKQSNVWKKSTGKRNYDTESIEETEAEDQLI